MAFIITLTTDFGPSDAYVAAMKGVILSINPQANIIDISHSIEPQNVLQAAFILNVAYRYFPAQTVHVAVVDPGVGSERRGIILKTPLAFFVAPDNGILSYIVDELSSGTVEPARKEEVLRGVYFGERRPEDTGFKMAVKQGLEMAAISDPRFWREPISPVFHGRDIFAPVAAGLSLGISPYEFGEKINSLTVLPIPKPYTDSSGNLMGQVLCIDHFGNLTTNIKVGGLPGKHVGVEIVGRLIHGLSSYYAQDEGLMAILGSSGYLEISVRNGSACDFLGARIGDEVKVILPLEAEG